MKKLIAILLMISLALSLAACGSDDEAANATTVEETTLAQETTVEETTADTVEIEPETVEPSATAAEAETTLAADGETTTAAEEETTKAPVTAPVNGTKEQIIAFYNKAANDTKAYAGTMTVSRAQGTTATINEISPEFVRGKAEEILPNDYPQNSKITFTNGKSSSGDVLKRFIPLNDDVKMSKLATAGVKSATCTQSGDTYKVSITLISESGNDLNFKPMHHGSCMDTLNITPEDLKPFTLKGASVTYTGATIVAVVNADGLLVSCDIAEPAVIDGKLALAGISLIEVNVTGTWKQEMKFTYA